MFFCKRYGDLRMAPMASLNYHIHQWCLTCLVCTKPFFQCHSLNYRGISMVYEATKNHHFPDFPSHFPPFSNAIEPHFIPSIHPFSKPHRSSGSEAKACWIFTGAMLVSAGPVIIKAPGVATSPILKWDAAPGVEGKKKRSCRRNSVEWVTSMKNSGSSIFFRKKCKLQQATRLEWLHLLLSWIFQETRRLWRVSQQHLGVYQWAGLGSIQQSEQCAANAFVCHSLLPIKKLSI